MSVPQFPSARETGGERTNAVMPRLPPVGHDTGVVFLHKLDIEQMTDIT